MNNINAIVINTVDFRDNDLILNTITNLDEKKSFLVKGVKKNNSKNKKGCNLYSKINVNYVDCANDERKQLILVKTIDKCEYFGNIRKNLILQSAAIMICEITHKINSEKGLYELVSKSLSLLNENKNSIAVLSLFISDVLKIVGIKPCVDSCVICGAKKKIVDFSIDKGGLICDNCKNGVSQYDLLDVKILRFIFKAGIDNIDFFKDYKLSIRHLDIVVNYFYQHFGIKIKSYDFYKTSVEL